LFEDGKPGELFITMSKEGSTIGGLMDSLGTAISVALQYGVPIESLVTKFSHQRFEPAGMTDNRDIPFAKSLVDYIFRWLGMQFVAGYREANAPQRESDGKGSGSSPTAAVSRIDAVIRGMPGMPSGAAMAMDIAGSMAGGSAGSGAAAQSVGAKPTMNALNDALAEAQTDAPACDVCGNVTVRSGTCYKCLNCGNSMGCS
jgi:ribonucleoside-diphosphate reductase alpha chain